MSQACGLSAETITGPLPYYLPLAEHIASLQAAKGATLTIGIQGPQAAGKTTLTQLLQRVLSDVAALRVCTLSIEDIYLTRSERAELATRVHSLFITRGVPGTHDVELGVRVLEGLTRRERTPIPRFDKAQDDRMPPSAWPVIDGPCDVVLFEGLWIGLPALADAALAVPINALEAREDPRGIWRGFANQQLRGAYPALFAPCERLIHFQAPDFACAAATSPRDHTRSRRRCWRAARRGPAICSRLRRRRGRGSAAPAWC